METVATVISVSGLAWARNNSGELRLLAAGDSIQADEALVTTPATRLIADFGNGQLVRFVGAEKDASAGSEPEIPVLVVPPAQGRDSQGGEQSDNDQPLILDDNHYFVQLVKIAEMIESDGLTPLNVAAIQEVLKPLQMGWERSEPEPDEHWYSIGGDRDFEGFNADTVAPGVTVTLQGAGVDGIYDAAEIGPDNSVTAILTLEPGTEVDDILVVTDKDGNELLNRPVTQDDLNYGIQIEVPVQPGDTNVTVNATVTDPSGNSGSDTAEQPIDTVPPTVSVELTEAGADGVYSRDEIGADNSVTAQVTLEPGTEVGDVLVVTDKDGDELLNRPVTQDDLDKGVSLEIPVQPGDADVAVNAKVTDPAGNSGTDTDEKNIDWPVSVDVPIDQTAVAVDGNSSDQVVFESALSDGSSPGIADTKVNSSFTLTAPDGLADSEAIGLDYTDASGHSRTLNLSKAAVEALGSASQSINTQYGTLVLNGYTRAADGTVTLDYEYTLVNAPEVTGNEVFDNIVVTVADRDGDTDAKPISIKIVDDAPAAENDQNAIVEDSVAVTGNVIGGTGVSSGDVADTQGADGAEISAISSQNEPSSSATDNSGVLEIRGEYGTLTINPDGSYSYALDNDNADVNALKDGETLDEVFTYILTDDDGDQDDATLTITINGVTDGAPSIIPADENGTGVAGAITVSESGLASGTNAASDDELASGTITITAQDGLASINIAGQDFDLAALQALSPTSSATIPVEGGTLELTGFTSTAAVGGVPTKGELSYTYTLTGERVHNGTEDDALTLDIPLSVTDAAGGTGSGTLQVQVEDDTPIAADDTGSVTEGATLTVNAASGVLNNDTSGADGWANGGSAVVGVAKGNTNSSLDDSNTLGTAIAGDYGILTLNADGSYTYVSTANAVTADATDVFTYTVKDADGDLTQATLTINVNDVTGAPTDTTDSVNEAGLADGTNPGNGHTASGSLNLQSDWSVATPQSGTSTHGTWSVDTDGNFIYELTSATDDIDGADETDSFTYTAVDQYGNTVENTVTVTIVDDQPQVTATATEPGNLIVDETALGTGATNTDFVKDVFGVNYGADGAAATDATVYSLKVTDGTASGVIDTESGESVYLYLESGQVVGRVGNSGSADESGETAFVITVDPDSGAATLIQSRPLEHSDTSNHDDPLSLTDNAIQLVATVTDSDGDMDSASVDVGNNFVFKDDGPSISVAPADGTVDEAHLAKGSATTKDTDQIEVSNSLNVDFGTDGAGDVQFTTGDTDSTVASLEALDFKSDGAALVYEVAADGHTLTAYKGSVASGNEVFTVEITDPTGTPGYTFTLNGALDHVDGSGDTVDTLDLVFDNLAVTDKDGDSVSTDFTITVKDDAPQEGIAQTHTVDEDSDGNIFVTNADATGSNTSIGSDSDGNADTFAPSHGTATVNDDGTITYVPDANYSGTDTFTYTTETDNETKTYTVEVTVNPISDAPDLEDDKSITTPEDTPADLGLKTPVIADYTDQNGDGTEGDDPERLGAITLTLDDAAPEGTVLTKSDGTALVTNSDGGYTIVIVKSSGSTDVDTDLHLSEGLPTDNVNYLTQAEYEALQVKPADDRHENLEVTVSVDSYEVDGDGKKLDGVGGANSQQTISVDVQAVTDAPEITLVAPSDPSTVGADSLSVTQPSGGTNGKITVSMSEDTTLDLQSVLNESLADTDGSESYGYSITGLPEGTVVSIGGTDYTADASGNISISTDAYLSSDNGANPGFSITPPKDYSSDETITATITLNTLDSDDDSDDANPTTESVSVDLELTVTPVAGDVTAAGVTTEEDTAVNFLKNVQVTDVGTGTEVIDSISFEIPTDWVVTAPVSSSGWSVSGTGTSGDPYTITFDDTLTESDREALLDSFTVTPPAHSSADASISLAITTTDANGSDTNTKTITETIAIEVTPVAEKIAADGDAQFDTDGDGSADLTMNGDHAYGTPGTEDGWLTLGQEGDFNLETDWSNDDSTEDTYALFTPYQVAGNDASSNTTGDALDGSSFQYTDDSGIVHTLIYNGEAVAIPVDYLDSVQFKGPENFSGVVKIKVEAGTVDYDEDEGTATEMAVSGEAWLTNVIVEPEADQVTLSVNSRIVTDEDTTVALNIFPTSSDDDETFTVTLGDIPDGSAITYIHNGTEYVIDETFDASGIEGLTVEKGTDEDGTFSLTIENFDTANQPTLTPPLDSNEAIDLSVKAVSVDTLTYIDTDGNTQTITSTSEDSGASQELDIHITVQGVPDEPVLVTEANQTYAESDLDDTSNQVSLSDLITSFGTGETTADDSETVTLRLSGLPEEFTLVGAGSVLGGSGESRVWVISQDQLNDVKIQLTANYSGTVTFTAQPVVTESDNDSDTFFEPQNISFTVTPSPEATLSISSDLVEDEIGQLDLSAVYQNGDSDESVSAVKITAVDGLTFYSDAAGTTELTLTDGVYLIEGDAIDSVYVKGSANDSSSVNLDVDYKVTDPSTDETLDAVESDSWIEGTHTLNFSAVTDEIDAALNNITGTVDGTGDSFTFDSDSSTATLNGSGDVTVTVDITQQPDTDAGGQADTDGSEQLTHMVISGVPDGVSVEGAVNTGPGEWLYTISSSNSFDTATLSPNLIFNVTGNVGNVTQEITITSYSQDTGGDSYAQAEISWTLSVSQSDDDAVELPEVALTLSNTPETEDSDFALSDQVSGTLTGGNQDSFDITVTLRTSPDDETAFTDGSGTPLTRTEVTENGETVVLWTRTVSVTDGNGDDELAALLADIRVSAPADANSNNLTDGVLPLDVTVSVHAMGLSDQYQVEPQVTITPVTDSTTVTVEADPVTEGEDITLSISLDNPADGEFSAIDGNVVYLELGDSGLAGDLYLDGELLEADNGVYTIELDDNGQPPVLTFKPDASQPYQTGSLAVTAWVNHTETGASNQLKSEGTGSLVIQPSNSGYAGTITAEGNEQTQDQTDADPIQLVFSDNAGLLDSDEEVDSAFVSGLPEGFTLYVGEDAASATLANNAGSDADGNNIWSIPVTGDDLPDYIAILPPTNWSGTLDDLTLTVMSGESGLEPSATEIDFNLVVNPVADGISLNPTLSFGEAGDVIDLNLNAAMKDPVANDAGVEDQYTELTTLELSGFDDGEKTLFYIDGVEIHSSRVNYDSDTNTHTITGLTQDELDGLGFSHSGTADSINIAAWTQEVDGDGNAAGDPSASVSTTVDISVSDKLPTTGDDTLLWSGENIDGRAGEDTIQLRFGESLSGDQMAENLSNIEAVDINWQGDDVDGQGSASITALGVEDVLNMTDDDNILRISGEDGASITLDSAWGTGTDNGTYTTYTATLDSQTVTLEVQSTLVD